MNSTTLDCNPIVTVITPNYNGHRFLRRVVECVRSQNFNLEHIIVDDCSTDDSWELLQSLRNDFTWLKPIRLDKNSGPVVARNKAIELAKGRFLAFLDVDDLWLSHKISTQIDFMLKEACVLSFSDYRFISEDGLKIGRLLRGSNKVGWHLHHMTRYLGCLTIIVDRAQYPDFKMPDIPRSVHAEDFLAWSACIRRHGAALRCPYDLARYSVVTDSRSSNKKNAFQSVWIVYRVVESISLPLALFYSFAYAIGVLWKRYWHRPFMNRADVDMYYQYSLLPEIALRRE
ncbi:MAG: hypothetical protein RLZZ107_1259 [Bacteroidota bacterium]|jgi:glycosyltransferase involved in cell wall biosynthesis